MLGLPLGLGEQIAGLIPPLPVGVTIEQAMKDDRELRHLYTTDTEAREVIDLGAAVGGLAAQFQHPRGRRGYRSLRSGANSRPCTARNTARPQ